jgi:tetratricopeptide (TPR) repeat protein
MTAAQGLATSDPAAALDWFAREPMALVALAQNELADPDGDLKLARARAQDALRVYPLEARALTLLGLIAERERAPTSAEVLMRLSGARSWRDRITHSWLFNSDVRRGDYAGALPHIDAILRAYREARSELFPVLAALTVTPPAFKALTDFLATAPPWRGWFLYELSTRLANQSRLVELYAALADTGSPPSEEELRPYLNRLVRDGNFEQAYETWRQTLPPAQRAKTTYLYNGDFELPLDGSPFNWVLTPIPGADIQVVAGSDGGAKRALLVQFSGARVQFANVRQLLMLPPGNFTLAGEAKTESLNTPRGLRWRLICADGANKHLAETELLSGSRSWARFSAGFQVPKQGCQAQWLQLELPARIASERAIEGQAWYQNLRVTPQSATGLLGH